jgi:hypothetical protein
MAWAATGAGAATDTSHLQKTTASGADPRGVLVYMREEVKLARDVYAVLSDAWRVDVFQGTAGSKQALMEDISDVLAQYGIDDPPAAAGIFRHAELQELYAYLVDQGMRSVNDALDVTILVEQTVIADVDALINDTEQTALRAVLTRLKESSLSRLLTLTRHLAMY